MTSLALKRTPLPLHLGARAAAVTGVYLAAAAAVLLTVILLRGCVPAAALSRFLGFVLVASLAAGLEPGGIKGAALSAAGVEGVTPAAYLAATIVKGLAASPVLALLWRFADPGAPLAVLAWAPALAIAGFCATELRAWLDLHGRYGWALGIKQGSLAGGVALAGVLIAHRLPLSAAVGISTLTRVASLALGAHWIGKGRAAALADAASTGRQVRGLLADRRWIDLAALSVIGAASGGADRLFGLRYLAPAAYGGYFLTYELFSRFWLIPYLLSPILFARKVAGVVDDPFVGAAWRLTGFTGIAFVAGAAGVVVMAPALLRQVVGATAGPGAVGFAAAVVINSFSQLRVAELQGAGRSRRAAAAAAFGAAVSIPLFLLAARAFGAEGLLIAWLAKAILELAALTLGAPARTKAGDGTAAGAR
jgi:hypothetical protein